MGVAVEMGCRTTGSVICQKHFLCVSRKPVHRATTCVVAKGIPCRHSVEQGAPRRTRPVATLDTTALTDGIEHPSLRHPRHKDDLASLFFSSRPLLMTSLMKACSEGYCAPLIGRPRSLSQAACSSSSHQAGESPQVIANPAGINNEVLGRLTRLREPYKPLPFIKNRHVETVFAAFFRSRPNIKYRREYLKMEDGGTVALDWPIGGDHPEIWNTDLSETAPVAVLLPGLTGGSEDSYVRHMVLRLRKHGWRPAVFNSRGCGDSPVTSPQFYSASFTEDLRQVVKHVRALCPVSRLYGIGWSLGANILVNYLGQEGKQSLLSGAVSLCNPFDLIISNEDFSKGFNNVYNRSLGRGLRKIFQKHAKLFDGIGGEYNIDLVARAKTVREFDEGLTRVSFGYRTVEEYYADASSSRAVKNVTIPVLCIQAADDPIAPIRAVPRDEIEASSNFILVVTPRGGHLGWMAGEGGAFGCPWTDPVTMSYLEILEDIYKNKVGLEETGGEDGKAKIQFAEEQQAGSERTLSSEPLLSH